MPRPTMRVVLALTALLALSVGATSAFAEGSLKRPNIAKAAKTKTLSKSAIKKLVKKEAKKHPGPAGAAGPAGPVGPAGAPGPAGAAGGSSSAVAKFACKTNQGISDPSCGTVYNSDGLRLQAECAVNGLAVRTTVAGAVMNLFGVQSDASSFGAAFANTSVNDGFILTPQGGALGSSGVATFTPPNSSTVLSVNFAGIVAGGSPQGDCVFYGTIVKA